MKLTTVTKISLDGVVEGPRWAMEGGFERGGWAKGYFDFDAGEYLAGVFERADALLFGRWALEYFAAGYADVKPGEYFDTRRRYLATTWTGRPGKPIWPGTTVLAGDVSRTIPELKVESEGELQVYGSPRLVRSLLKEGLVDEMILLVVPILVGGGHRLFDGYGPSQVYDLVESRAFSVGTMLQVYRPAWR